MLSTVTWENFESESSNCHGHFCKSRNSQAQDHTGKSTRWLADYCRAFQGLGKGHSQFQQFPYSIVFQYLFPNSIRITRLGFIKIGVSVFPFLTNHSTTYINTIFYYSMLILSFPPSLPKSLQFLQNFSFCMLNILDIVSKKQ